MLQNLETQPLKDTEYKLFSHSSHTMSYGHGDLTPGGYGSSDQYTNSYQNDGGLTATKDFPRMTKLISSNIQKIQQNGEQIPISK